MNFDNVTSLVFYDSYSTDEFTTLSDYELDFYYELLEITENSGNDDFFEVVIANLPENWEKTIKKLRSTIVVINFDNLKQDFNLISSIKISPSHLYFKIDNFFIDLFLNYRKKFDNFFIKVDWALQSKFSKFLYRILVNNRNSQYCVKYEILLVLLNLHESKYFAGRSFSTFEREVLKKSINELNKFSDLLVSYEVIRDEHDEKIINDIVFTIETQEVKASNFTLSEQEELYLAVSKRIEEKANLALKEIERNKKITNKRAYLNAIIKNFERKEIEAEIRITNWLNKTKDFFVLETDQPSLLFLHIENNEDDWITIRNDLCLLNLTKNKLITKKPSRTLKLLNDLLSDDKVDVEFKQIGRIYDECLISYVNGWWA